MLVRLKGKPMDTRLVLVYVPMHEHKDEEIDALYEMTEDLIEKETKGKDYTIVMREWITSSMSYHIIL
jgi:hypothetical protein